MRRPSWLLAVRAGLWDCSAAARRLNSNVPAAISCTAAPNSACARIAATARRQDGNANDARSPGPRRIFVNIVRAFVLTSAALALGLFALRADVFTPDNLGPPFAVQPGAGLMVTGGVTESFFSDVSGLPFPGPDILDVLADIQAVDSTDTPISTFSITGVTVTQSSSFSPTLEPFSLASPATYASFLDPSTQVTVNPGDLNLAFAFSSDSSFQYSYTLNVSGVPDGGFVLFNDVEGALVPEPALGLPLILATSILLA